VLETTQVLLLSIIDCTFKRDYSQLDSISSIPVSPRSAVLKPKESISRKAAGLASWVVSVPPSLSDTGKRSQRFFRTKNEAQNMCEDLKFRRFKFGHSLRNMTPELIAEASEAGDILAPFNISLLTAVRAFVADYQASHASVSLQALFAMFIEEKHDRHPSYLAQLRMTLRRMPQLQEKMVSDIDHHEIEAILRPLSPRAQPAHEVFKSRVQVRNQERLPDRKPDCSAGLRSATETRGADGPG
jgi:hypothetical protein